MDERHLGFDVARAVFDQHPIRFGKPFRRAFSGVVGEKLSTVKYITFPCFFPVQFAAIFVVRVDRVAQFVGIRTVCRMVVRCVGFLPAVEVDFDVAEAVVFDEPDDAAFLLDG